MSWKTSENSDNIRPSEIEKTKHTVFIRKDFEEVPTYDEEGVQIGTHWKYLENKIPIEDWSTYEQVMANTSNIADLEEAVCELSL